MYHPSAEKLSAKPSARRSEFAVSSVQDIWSERWECTNSMQACNWRKHVLRNIRCSRWSTTSRYCQQVAFNIVKFMVWQFYIRCSRWSTTSRYCQQVAFNIVKFMVWQFFSHHVGKIKDTLRYAASLHVSCNTHLQWNWARRRLHVTLNLCSSWIKHAVRIDTLITVTSPIYIILQRKNSNVCYNKSSVACEHTWQLYDHVATESSLLDI